MAILLAHGVMATLAMIMKTSPRLKKAESNLGLVKWYIVEICLVRMIFVCFVNLETYFKSGAWSNLKFDAILDRIFTLVFIIVLIPSYVLLAI